MKKLLLFLMLVVPLSGAADTYTMKAFGHPPVKLYGWWPQFSNEDYYGDEARWHCIFSRFLVNKSYLDVKRQMDEGGFITVQSFKAKDFSTDWPTLRIQPDNVEWCDLDADITWWWENYHYTHKEIMKKCGL